MNLIIFFVFVLDLINPTHTMSTYGSSFCRSSSIGNTAMPGMGLTKVIQNEDMRSIYKRPLSSPVLFFCTR
ncbi:hypothetical protein HanIR_Chr12g0585311 [Helianthus annuus]|nr:hypothetical protein HanIR_Chr12g0585311 [Helianthus annuus]